MNTPQGSGISHLRVTIINAVYPPEPVASAAIGRDLAERLWERGAEVKVLAPFPSRPMGADYKSFDPSSGPARGASHGPDVVRLNSFRSPESRLGSRMFESLSFGLHVCRYLRRSASEANVIYANAWPLFSQALIAWHSVRRRIPLVMHVQDVYPESLATKLPRLPALAASFALVPLDRWIAQSSHRVVVISENMRRTYVEERAVRPERVLKILNWTDERRFESMPSRDKACELFCLPSPLFTFLYLGNIGPVACVEGLLRAFKEASLQDAQLVIAGDGSAKSSCIKLAEALKLERVRFLSAPSSQVAQLHALAHVCLLPMRKGAGLTSIPSKLMSYFFSGRPIIAAVDDNSDTAAELREAESGWIEEPEDVMAMAERMRRVSAMPTWELEQIGLRGRTYALEHHSKSAGVAKLAAVILAAAGDQSWNE